MGTHRAGMTRTCALKGPGPVEALCVAQRYQREGHQRGQKGMTNKVAGPWQTLHSCCAKAIVLCASCPRGRKHGTLSAICVF